MALPAGASLRVSIQRTGPPDVSVSKEGQGSPKAANLAIKQQFDLLEPGQTLNVRITAVETLPEA